MRIDAHQHFWHYQTRDYGWINEEMAVLKRNFLPDDLGPILKQHQLDGCIAVQARQTMEETSYLLNLAEENDWIKGVVGWVDLQADDAKETIDKIAKHPKLVGIRHIVQDEPDDRFMLRPNFLRGIQYLTDAGIPYDILIYPRQLDAAIELVQQFPNQKFVIDHIAKPYINAGRKDGWAAKLSKLGQYDHVWCKVSGIITEANWSGWDYEQIQPYLEVVAQSFRPEKLMYGSDWPVCLLAGSYSDVYSVAKRFADRYLADDQAAFWGRNAEAFYGLGPKL